MLKRVHHMDYLVRDMDQAIEEAVRTLKAQGVRLLNEKPRLGKDNWKLIDIAEEETCGFMVQLVEP